MSEQLSKSQKRRLAAMIPDTPMTSGPGARCGWTEEGYRILMSQPSGARMEMDTESIQRLYRYAARMAHRAKVLRAKLDNATHSCGGL